VTDEGEGDPCPECGDVHETCEICDERLDCDGNCDDADCIIADDEDEDDDDDDE
jgi:hypothetical protein